jgi:cation-transporting P-type ATPase 13A2
MLSFVVMVRIIPSLLILPLPLPTPPHPHLSVGANDMAALRAATVGVSLCEAETSVAAPVTSRLQTPGAVVEVIKEGRCSLITAYVLVAFNIMYGTIQLFMAIMMYNFGLELGNNTYLIQDLFYTLVLGLAISITPPSQTLSKELPPQRFFTKYFCFKLFSQLICFPIFQLIALAALRRQSWYEKYDFGDDPLSETYAYETSVIASLGLAQVMIASVVSTIDEPFRRNWYTNKYHVMALVFQTGFLLYQIFGRESYFMKEILEIRPLKIDFCWILILIILANCVVSGLLSWLADLIKHLSQRKDLGNSK